MRRADIIPGERYAVNALRTDYARAREVLMAAVNVKERWDGNKIAVKILPQEVRRNDGRNGTTTIKGYDTLVSTKAILRPWAEEQAERDRKKAEEEAQREQWKREWEAEKIERKAALREWVYPFEGILVSNDDDMNSGMPRTMWDKRHEAVDLAHFLIEFWGEQESTTLTVREPFMQKIAAQMAEQRRQIEALSLALEFAGVHPNTIKALKEDNGPA